MSSLRDLQQYPSSPGWPRAALVAGGLALGAWLLVHRVQTRAGEMVTKVGRIEVTARLVDCPEKFPDLGAYRYTWVLKYEVREVHRRDPAGKYPLKAGDTIYVGHYRPWLPRKEARDADCKEKPLGSLDRFAAGDVHRMALDYELSELAPAGVLDYCPPEGDRFFAYWVNATSL